MTKDNANDREVCPACGHNSSLPCWSEAMLEAHNTQMDDLVKAKQKDFDSAAAKAGTQPRKARHQGDLAIVSMPYHCTCSANNCRNGFGCYACTEEGKKTDVPDPSGSNMQQVS